MVEYVLTYNLVSYLITGISVQIDLPTMPLYSLFGIYNLIHTPFQYLILLILVILVLFSSGTPLGIILQQNTEHKKN